MQLTREGRVSFECDVNERFPKAETGQDCGCNRLIVAAMMSALDVSVCS